MIGFFAFDWEESSLEYALAMVELGSTREINALGRSCPRDTDPIEILSAVLARPDCSLGTALTIFARTEPAWWENPVRHAAPMAQFLRELVDRVNAGEFAHDPADGADDVDIIEEFLGDPKAALARPFALDPDVVEPALNGSNAETAGGPASGMPECPRDESLGHLMNAGSGRSTRSIEPKSPILTVIPGGRA